MENEMIYLPLDKIIPYENNPRKNDRAVDSVAESLKEFGPQSPIILDKNHVIICGHTRYKAAKKIGLAEFPCVIASGLSEEQAIAYRLADNKTGEQADWDFDLLDDELARILDIDMSAFGFVDTSGIDWDDVPELTEKTYEEPPKTLLRCPHCQHVDSATHFIKVKE